VSACECVHEREGKRYGTQRVRSNQAQTKRTEKTQRQSRRHKNKYIFHDAPLLHGLCHTPITLFTVTHHCTVLNDSPTLGLLLTCTDKDREGSKATQLHAYFMSMSRSVCVCVCVCVTYDFVDEGRATDKRVVEASCTTLGEEGFQEVPGRLLRGYNRCERPYMSVARG
jgi:hypothetical protein